jgi:hypothetical protein
MPLHTTDQIKARFEELPEVVQDAILDSDVPGGLRALYEASNLHLDKWETLQRIVMSALVGLMPTSHIGEALKSELSTDEATTAVLVEGLATRVFKPVRERLERGLGHPEAKTEEVSDVEKLRREVLKTEGAIPPPPPQAAATPGTPPPPKPDTKVVRGPASGAYKPGETSTNRKAVLDDPYREQPL